MTWAMSDSGDRPLLPRYRGKLQGRPFELPKRDGPRGEPGAVAGRPTGVPRSIRRTAEVQQEEFVSTSSSRAVLRAKVTEVEQL